MLQYDTSIGTVLKQVALCIVCQHVSGVFLVKVQMLKALVTQTGFMTAQVFDLPTTGALASGPAALRYTEVRTFQSARPFVTETVVLQISTTKFINIFSL